LLNLLALETTGGTAGGDFTEVGCHCLRSSFCCAAAAGDVSGSLGASVRICGAFDSAVDDDFLLTRRGGSLVLPVVLLRVEDAPAVVPDGAALVEAGPPVGIA